MDASLRKNIAARDAALSRTGRVTRLVGVAATAGSLALMAGFAHLIPTHLPHLSVGGTGGAAGTSGTGNGSGASSGNGAPGPGSGSGTSHVTSGGS